MKYKFTSEVPMIFHGLTHGAGVVVTSKDGVVEAPEGSTVRLNPGDSIQLPDDITTDSVWLKPARASRKEMA